MATRAVTDEQLQGIADAIKLKSGDDTPMSVADMAMRIGLIEGGMKSFSGTFVGSGYATVTFDIPFEPFVVIAKMHDKPQEMCTYGWVYVLQQQSDLYVGAVTRYNSTSDTFNGSSSIAVPTYDGTSLTLIRSASNYPIPNGAIYDFYIYG